MRNKEKGNKMTTIDFEHGLTENVDVEDAHNTTWSECQCAACTSTPDYEEWPPVGGGHFNDGMW